MRRAPSGQRVGFTTNNGNGVGSTSTQPTTQPGHRSWPSQGDGDLADWEADTHDEGDDTDSSAPGDGSDTDGGPNSGELGSSLPHSASMPRLIAGAARVDDAAAASVLSSTPPEPETEHYYKTQRQRRLSSRPERTQTLPTQAQTQAQAVPSRGASSPSPPTTSLHRAQSSPSRLGGLSTAWDGRTVERADREPSPTERTAALETQRQRSRSIHDTLLEYKGAFVGVPLGVTVLALVTVLGFDLMRSPR